MKTSYKGSSPVIALLGALMIFFGPSDLRDKRRRCHREKQPLRSSKVFYEQLAHATLTLPTAIFPRLTAAFETRILIFVPRKILAGLR